MSTALDRTPSVTVWYYASAGSVLAGFAGRTGEIGLDKRIREKLNQKLRGFEYRQQDRQQRRAIRQKAYRIAGMMRDQGTLRGARKYLDLKGIPYHESVDPATGNSQLTIPEQVTLSYDSRGKFVSSGPPPVRAVAD